MSKKFISARSRQLVRVCIRNSVADENNCDVDIIEDTPQCSPTEKPANALPLAGSNRSKLSEHEDLSNEITGEKNVNPLFSGTRCFEDFITNFEENVGDKSIEPPPYSPLTPRPLSNLNALVYEKQCMNSLPITVEPMGSPDTQIQPLETMSKKSIKPPECFEENVEEKSIEPPPYSPLTPRPLSNLNALVYEKLCMNSPPINVEHIKSTETHIQPHATISKNSIELPECFEENVGEKSIDPPPFSPLTPRPLSNFNARVYEKLCLTSFPINVAHVKSPATHIQPQETISEKSVEPVFSPLITNPNEHTILDLPSSPLRSMSPETTNLYNILTEDFENECRTPATTFNIDPNSPTASLASSDRTVILFNSDDSVQDPDFACNNDIGESDTSSSVSASLITTVAEVYQPLAEANGLQTSTHSNETQQLNTSETTRSSQGRPKKGRKRKYGEYSREERKKRKYQNLSYINSRKRHIDPQIEQRLYTPEDYMQIMRTCKKIKPMQVNRMRKDDFLSSINLEKIIINRKKASDGSKVSWLNTKEIMMKKDDEFSIFMRSNLDDDYAEINLKKNTRGNTGRLSKEIMNPLWPNGKPIPEAKLNDLKSLLHLIPEDAQDFYKKLTGDITVEDDIDGFSGEVDFEVEEDDINN